MSRTNRCSVVAAIVVTTLCFCTTSLQAQWFVGPSIQYLITTNTPTEVSRASPPTRLALGVQVQKELKSKLAVAFEANYRTENGEMKTDYVAAKTTPRVQVVTPGGTGPQIVSTFTSSSIEASAMLKIPLVDLDSSGTALHLNLGALADRVLSTKQVDDYSQIPDYLGAKSVEVEYTPQFGFAAMFGVSVGTNMGSGKLLFDLRFVFRNPKTALTNSTPPQEQDLSWLIGQGMRFGVSYLFAL